MILTTFYNRDHVANKSIFHLLLLLVNLVYVSLIYFFMHQKDISVDTLSIQFVLFYFAIVLNSLSSDFLSIILHFNQRVVWFHYLSIIQKLAIFLFFSPND